MATMMFSLVALLCCIGMVRGGGAGYGRTGEWSYNWNANPQGNWGSTFPKCKATNTAKQSPININSRDTVYASMELETNNYDDTGDVYFNMANSGSSIGFTAVNDDGKIPQTVEFKGITYRLYQFHFHWGSTLYQGSEHEVDSTRFPAELHVIHYNTKYASASEALAEDDGLLVWGHFLKADSKTKSGNAQLQKLLDQFSKVASSHDTVKVEDVDLRALIPAYSDDFFHYSGSLTTPPCHESVQWIVNKNPIHVSDSQMAVFRSLKDDPMKSVAGVAPASGDNYREPQALNGRVVQRNFDDLVCKNSGFATKPIVVMMSLAAAVCYFLY